VCKVTCYRCKQQSGRQGMPTSRWLVTGANHLGRSTKVRDRSGLVQSRLRGADPIDSAQAKAHSHTALFRKLKGHEAPIIYGQSMRVFVAEPHGLLAVTRSSTFHFPDVTSYVSCKGVTQYFRQYMGARDHGFWRQFKRKTVKSVRVLSQGA